MIAARHVLSGCRDTNKFTPKQHRFGLNTFGDKNDVILAANFFALQVVSLLSCRDAVTLNPYNHASFSEFHSHAFDEMTAVFAEV